MFLFFIHIKKFGQAALKGEKELSLFKRRVRDINIREECIDTVGGWDGEVFRFIT